MARGRLRISRGPVAPGKPPAAAGAAPRNVPIRLALALFAALAVTLYLMGGLAARYAATDSGDDGARVAGFTFDLADGESSHVVDLAKIRMPGDSRTFTFKVVNGGEVSRRYRLTVELNGSMPLEVAVVDSDDNSNVIGKTTVNDLNTQLVDGGKLERSSDYFAFAPNDPSPREYTLTATWPEGEADADYANNASGVLVVRAVAEQVD